QPAPATAAAPEPRVAMIEEEPALTPTPATLRVPVPSAAPAATQIIVPPLPEAKPLVPDQHLAPRAADTAPTPAAKPVHPEKPLMARVATALARLAKSKPVVTEPARAPRLATAPPVAEPPHRSVRTGKLHEDRRAARAQEARETNTRRQTHVVTTAQT